MTAVRRTLTRLLLVWLCIGIRNNIDTMFLAEFLEYRHPSKLIRENLDCAALPQHG